MLAAVKTPPTAEATRAFGIAETLAVAGFLVQCAQLIVQLWQVRQDRAALVKDLHESSDLAKIAPNLDPEKRLDLMARFLWSILAKTGRYGNAAIFHDWLYAAQPCMREVADRVFDRALNDMGVDDATRKTMWAAVRVFGGTAWRNYAHAKAKGIKYVLRSFPDNPTIRWSE